MKKKVKKDNTLKIITHLLGLFSGFIGPLVVFLATSDIDEKNHAKNALNWQISLIIYRLISFILILILIGIAFMFVLGLLDLIFSVVAAIKAKDDELWKYPLAISFFK